MSKTQKTNYASVTSPHRGRGLWRQYRQVGKMGSGEKFKKKIELVEFLAHLIFFFFFSSVRIQE